MRLVLFCFSDTFVSCTLDAAFLLCGIRMGQKSTGSTIFCRKNLDESA